MAVRLINLSISGIKNIKDEINISFYNDYQSKKSLEEESRIKAIYGPNGSGKTAICIAAHYYKQLLINPRFLATDEVQSFKSFVNSITKVFSVTSTFYIKYDNKPQGHKYKHSIVVDFNDRFPILKSESLYILGPRNQLKEVYSYTFKDGFKSDIKIDGIQYNTSLELLCSIPRKIMVSVENFSDKRLLDYGSTIFAPLVFGASIFVYFCESKDLPTHAFFKDNKKHIKLTKIIDESVSLVDSSDQIKFNELVETKDKKKYEKRLEKMASFVKLMKPDLKTIKPRYYPLPNGLEGVDLYLIYEDNKTISLSFESTGVKKIIKMFDIFNNANKDKIIFIDEIDADIHDLFLSTLVDYFVRYSKAQIIFTTHNIDLMNNIKALKHSIDFISQDNVLTPWIKNGTASPSKAYLNGMISHIPFNLYSSDFIGIFEGEDNE